LRGRRLHAKAPAGRWQTTTMIAALRVDGRTACMTVNAATDTEVFHSYIEQVLLPTLEPGDIVVMDNLTPHKSPRILALIEAAGAEALFLPPYSPDLNPIEKMWSKVKASLRRQEARTPEQLDQAIAVALAEVTAKDAASWFASCGYSFI
jgi:transposase